MEKNVRILLVEDELIIADYMQDCLQQFGYDVAGICINYNEAVDALTAAPPDIVLLDITLKGEKSGIDLAGYINQHVQVPFVYITSHSDRATIDKAKKTLPYAYLIKPFNEGDLYAAIETALLQFASKKETQEKGKSAEEAPIIIKDGIFVRHKSKFVKIQLDELLWIEANDNYATLHTSSTQYVLKTTLKTLLEALPANFLRIHRSYAVNLNHIKSFDSEEAVAGTTTLPIGKSYFAELLQKIQILQG